MNKSIVGTVIVFISVFFLLVSLSYSENSETFPQRVISLSPSITEELYLLGAEDKLIGCTTYCIRPKGAKTKEKVGTVIEVNLEKIVMLNPDIILATSLTDSKAVEKLKNLGIKIESFPASKNFNELCNEFLKLGKIVGKKNKAEEIVNDAKNKIDIIKRKTENMPHPTIFVQIGSSPLFAATDDYFIDDFINFAGGINIAENSKSGLYSREEVIKRNPDVIVIVTMGIAGDKEVKIWKNYKTLMAVKNNRIYILDSYRLCSSTPVSFVDTLKDFVEILHPEKRKINL